MISRLKVPIKPDIAKHCKNQINKHNFGRRGYADGTRKQQYIGIVGESVVMDMFDLGWVESTGFDGGVDFSYKNKTYDVKTMGRKVDVKDSYVNNFVKSQENYDVDRYIFTSINELKAELTICGWITKENFKKHRDYYEEGELRYRDDGSSFKTKADSYEIHNQYLHFVNNILGFKMQLE